MHTFRMRLVGLRPPSGQWQLRNGMIISIRLISHSVSTPCLFSIAFSLLFFCLPVNDVLSANSVPILKIHHQ
jgi:hypothetical protein